MREGRAARHAVRPALAAVAALLAAFVVVVARLPSAAACVASGRTVDPTGRHCVAADGTAGQLREHVLGHTAEVVAIALVLAGVAIMLRWGRHAVRRASRRAP